MQEEPRKRSFFTPAAYEAPITLSHGEIVGQEINGIPVVKGDATNLGRCQNDGIGFGCTDPLLRFGLAGEIQLGVIDGKNSARLSSKAAYQRRPHHPAMARDVNTLTGEVK